MISARKANQSFYKLFRSGLNASNREKIFFREASSSCGRTNPSSLIELIHGLTIAVRFRRPLRHDLLPIRILDLEAPAKLILDLA